MSFKSVGVAVALVLGVVSGTAWAADTIAAIVGPDGTIRGCYSTTNGALRVVEPGAACRNQELAISWSQQGPTGPQGPQGPAGPTGPVGPAGGLAGHELVQETVFPEFGGSINAHASCPSGKVAVGGGFEYLSPSVNDAALIRSRPTLEGDGTGGWLVDLDGHGTGFDTVIAWAVCVARAA